MDRNVDAQNLCVSIIQSLSARRAWIEIAMTGQISVSTVSLSARRAWIEIDSAVDSASGTLSLSARRAWIEI